MMDGSSWLELPEDACSEVKVLVNDGKRLVFLTPDSGNLSAELKDGKLVWGDEPNFPALPTSREDSFHAVWSNGVILMSCSESRQILQRRGGGAHDGPF